MNKPITSREYKLILNPDRFRDRQQGIEAFWELIQYLVEIQEGKSKKTANEEEEKRQTYYLDTVGLELYQQGFILRVREEKQDVSKITLKYRHTDRYLSASQDLSSSDEKGKRKFEEDILADASSKFSHSVSIEKEKPWSANEVKTIDDAITLFPGLKDLNIHKGTEMKTVNNFKAHEIACKLGHLDFDNGQTKIKAVLSFWYLLGKKDEFPLVVELSFGYDALEDGQELSQLERFPIQVVKQTHRWFETLKKQAGWVSEPAMTKTSYAYKV